MKNRIILANTLTVLGCLIGLCGLAAMAIWSEYEKTGSHELAALLSMLHAYNPPGFLVPVCSHLGGGALLAIIGERLRWQTAKEAADAKVRTNHFQSA